MSLTNPFLRKTTFNPTNFLHREVRYLITDPQSLPEDIRWTRPVSVHRVSPYDSRLRLLWEQRVCLSPAARGGTTPGHALPETRVPAFGVGGPVPEEVTSRDGHAVQTLCPFTIVGRDERFEVL